MSGLAFIMRDTRIRIYFFYLHWIDTAAFEWLIFAGIISSIVRAINNIEVY